MAALFRERALRFVRGLTVAAWVRKQPRDQPYHLVSPIPVRVSGRNETCLAGALSETRAVARVSGISH